MKSVVCQNTIIELAEEKVQRGFIKEQSKAGDYIINEIRKMIYLRDG
jgi:hypothetical protein